MGSTHVRFRKNFSSHCVVRVLLTSHLKMLRLSVLLVMTSQFFAAVRLFQADVTLLAPYCHGMMSQSAKRDVSADVRTGPCALTSSIFDRTSARAAKMTASGRISIITQRRPPIFAPGVRHPSIFGPDVSPFQPDVIPPPWRVISVTAVTSPRLMSAVLTDIIEFGTTQWPRARDLRFKVWSDNHSAKLSAESISIIVFSDQFDLFRNPCSIPGFEPRIFNAIIASHLEPIAPKHTPVV